MEVVVCYEILCLRKYDKAVKDIFNRARKVTGCDDKAEVAVIFIGDKKMRELNQIYRNKDKVSNVLSFSADPHPTLSRGERVTQGRVRDLGNIFICLPEAKREAKKYGLTVEYEIVRLAVHGFLHLLGYDHIQEKDCRKMEEVENRILKSVEKKYEVS